MFKDSEALVLERKESFSRRVVTSSRPWLQCAYSDSVWKLTPHIMTDEISRYTVSWIDEQTDGSSGWLYWVGMAKEQCDMKMSNGPPLATSSLVAYARSLRAFFLYLFVHRSCSQLEDVQMADVDAYRDSLASRSLKASTVEGYLQPIWDCYGLRRHLSESLTFDPFRGATYVANAKTIGGVGGHTRTLLPREVFFLLNEALKLVKEADGDLFLLDQYMRMRGEFEGGPRACARAFKRQYLVSASELRGRILTLYGAALMVTFLLTAERKHEAALREEVDVLSLLEGELDVLYGLEKKTAGSISGKRTEVAVIKEVKDAFRVIVSITKYKRAESGETKVLLKQPLTHSTPGGCRGSYYLHTASVYLMLDKFVASCGLNVRLRPHMLRRAFAMLWSWRYEVGDLKELSVMLKHNSSVFTERYTDDEHIWHFMPEAEQKVVFEIINAASLKKAKVCGGASKALERYGRIIQAKSKLLEPSMIAEFVGGLIDSGQVKVVPHADGFCVITSSTYSEAKCLDDAGLMAEELRTPARCIGCPNIAIDDKRRPVWERRIELHRRVVARSENATLRRQSEQFISEAEAVLRGFGV